MTAWGRALSAASLAAMGVRRALLGGMPSAAANGPVTPTRPNLMPAGVLPWQNSALALRAQRLHNRNRKAAAVYIRVHEILAKGS